MNTIDCENRHGVAEVVRNFFEKGIGLMATFLGRRGWLATGFVAAATIGVTMPPTTSAQESSRSFTVRSETEVQTEAGVETILRGPLHEAFAEPIALDVKPTVVIR